MDCSENQEFVSKTNQFKQQMELLLEEFRLFTFNDQLILLSDIRRFFLEVENICNAISHDVGDHDKDVQVLDSRLLPAIGSSYDDISASLRKTTTSDHQDHVHDHAAATLEETDIRQIADYLLGFSKLTDGNSNDQMIMNSDSTSSLLDLTSSCVRERPAAVEELGRQHDAAAAAAGETITTMPDDSFNLVHVAERPSKNQENNGANRSDEVVETETTRVNLRPRPARRRIIEEPVTSTSSSSTALSKPVLIRSERKRLKAGTSSDCSTAPTTAADQTGSSMDNVQRHVKASTFARRNNANSVRRSLARRSTTTTTNKLYECGRCERKFVKRPSLFAHQREHARPNEVVCLKCGVTSADAEQHALHVQRHAEHAPFRCKTCGESFARRQQYDRHTAGHRLYDCADCGAHFSTKKQVARHRRLMHGIHLKEEKRHECPVCQKRFLRRRQLDIHHRRSHTDVEASSAVASSVKCPLCSKSFRTPSALTKHLTNSAAHKRINASAADSAEATQTTAAATSIDVVSFPSVATQEEVEVVVAKVRHQASSTGDGDGHLVDGGRKNRRSRLRQEKSTKEVSGKEDDFPSYLCAVCGATFLRKQCLVRHNRQQHDGSGILYECDFCDYRCKCKANLKRHVELHVNERRRFVCELCGATFHALGTLKEHHAYVHCDERRHACSDCGKAFKSKSALQRHARVHKTDRPYVCTECTQTQCAYKRMSHLKRHMATMHGAIFESKRVRRLRSERPSSEAQESAPVHHPPPTFEDDGHRVTSNNVLAMQACNNNSDMMPASTSVNNDFLMIADISHNRKTSQLLDEVRDDNDVVQCLQPLPPMADIVPSVSGPLPSLHRRLLHHHVFLDVDYNSACPSGDHHNILQPIDILQSDLTAGTCNNSGTVDGNVGKISDIFW